MQEVGCSKREQKGREIPPAERETHVDQREYKTPEEISPRDKTSRIPDVSGHIFFKSFRIAFIFGHLKKILKL